MNRLLTCLCLAVSGVAMFATPVFGQVHGETRLQDVEEASALTPSSLRLGSNVRSKYVLANGFVLSEDGVIQSEISINIKRNLSIRAWFSMPAATSEINDDAATELDLTIDYAFKIETFNINIGFSYYDLVAVGEFEGIDFLFPYIEVARKFELSDRFSLTPFTRVEVRYDMAGDVDRAIFPRLGTRYAWKVWEEMIDIAGSAFVLYDPGIRGFDDGFIGNADLAVLWNPRGYPTIEFPYVRVVHQLNDIDDRRDETEFVIGAGISFRF